MLVVHATFPIDPEKREEALELMRNVAEASRAEEGVIDYRPAIDVDDPNIVRFLEEYEDEAAFEAHIGTDHFEELEAALPDLLAGEPDAARFDVSETSEIEL